MISMPTVQGGLFHVVWDGSCQVERGGCLMYLPASMLIQSLEVHRSAGLVVFFCCYDHAMAPFDRSVGWDFPYLF